MPPYLVDTDAGLAVHFADSPPLLASDRELPSAPIGVMGMVCGGCGCGLGLRVGAPRVGRGLCPQCRARSLKEKISSNLMSNTTVRVLSRRKIAEIVGPEASVLVGRIERAEMEFGLHHRWTDEQVFTEAGVQVLVEALAETHAGPSLALRAHARDFFAAPPETPAALPAPARIAHEQEARALVAPLRERANGYQPQET